MAYGAGVVRIIEPLLTLMIRRPEATPAGIPAGDPRIDPGSKCNAVRHSFPSRLVAFVHPPNTGLSPKSSASDPIGAKKKTHRLKRELRREREGAEGAEKARASEAVPLHAKASRSRPSRREPATTTSLASCWPMTTLSCALRRTAKRLHVCDKMEARRLWVKDKNAPRETIIGGM